MTDQQHSVDVDSRIAALETEVRNLRAQLAYARLEQWEGRIDDLELQMHLASMQANSRLTELIADLRRRWREAKHDAVNVTASTSEVLDRVRDGLEQAMREVRDAIAAAKDTVVR